MSRASDILEWYNDEESDLLGRREIEISLV